MIPNRSLVTALAIGGVCLLLVGRAQASPTDLYGAFPRGIATVATQTAAADDSGAALYNPAGIALAGASGKAQLQLGYAYGKPMMYVNRSQSDPSHPTSNPSDEGWITLGATATFGGKIKHRASLGFSFYLPQNNLVRVQALDPGNPQFVRYQADPDRMVLAGGLGVRVTDWLAVGVGAEILAGLSGTVNFNADIANRKVNQRNLDFALKPGLTPTAGITLTPLPAWRFALAYKGALQLDIGLPNNINVNGLGLQLDVTGSVLYTPPELAFGAQFTPTDRLKLAFDLKYDFWSKAPFPGLEVSVTPGGELAQGLGLDQLGFQTKDLNPNFKDTLTPSVAAEYLFPESGIIIRGGYCLRPPYAPVQVGGTNFLDSMTHIFGAGVTFQFHDPLEVFADPVKIDLAVQGQFSPAQQVVKAETGEPVGNYTYGGFAVAAGAGVRYEF